MAETKGREAPADAPGPEPVCPVGWCPVGMLLTATGGARPEVTEHLVKAGRELILAMSALLDTRAEELTKRQSIEKIDVE